MTKLLGREAELKALNSALRSNGALVLVSGEAGVGKSRLIREAIGTLDQKRPVVWGRAEQVTTPGPFALILDMLQFIVDSFPASSDAEFLLERLVASKRPQGLPIRRLAAELRGILALLGRRPVVVFEDLHASDEASQAAIIHLARSAAEDEHFLMATFRSEEVSGNEKLARFLETVARERAGEEIHLFPLEIALSIELAQTILPDTERAMLRNIAELSEGNPFFIEELAAAYSPKGHALPPTITRIVEARKQQLGPVAQQVLTVAALMWGSIDIDVLTLACELERSTVLRAITEALKIGLLEERTDRIVFRHALIREGLRDGLATVEVEELNRRIASGIETCYENDLAAHALALAQHWYWARERDRALVWALEAGNRALGFAATSEAQTAFELAVACSEVGPPPSSLSGLAEVEIRDGRAEAAEELLVRAARAYEDGGHFEEAAAALGRVAWIRTVTKAGDPLEAIDQGLALAERSTTNRQTARLLAQKGQIHIHSLGQLSDGQRLLKIALDAAAHEGDAGVQAECLDTLAWEAEFGRRTAEADRRAQDATEFALQSGISETIGRTFNNRALLLVLHGKPSQGLQLLESVRDRLRDSFGTAGLSVVDLTEAIAKWRMGEPASVAKLVTARENVWPHWRGYARLLDCWSALHLGDQDRAKRIVEARWAEVHVLREDVYSSSFKITSDNFEAAATEAILGLEGPIKARTPNLAQSLLDFSRNKPADDHLLAAWLAGRIFLALGLKDLAISAIEELFEELQTYESPFFKGLGHENAARLSTLHESNSITEERDHLTRAVEALTECLNSVDRARCLRAMALSLSTEEASQAIECARAARTIALEVGSSLESARAEATLRRLGVRPRAGRPRKSPEDKRVLTLREREIAALVAAGSTNSDIAARLFLSERTVQDHISNALKKISAPGRASLAAWAAKNGLV